MSYPAASVAGVFHPWRYLRDTHPGVLVWHTKTLPPAILGVTDGQDVGLGGDMTPAERRCTLVHEPFHTERGPRACQPP
ncbi:Gp43, partial [human gut metagenome]